MERVFWRCGLNRVAGVDEVGRGALAGPLVAAAAVFPCEEILPLRSLRAQLRGVCDSKLLTPLERERLAEKISRVADQVTIGEVSAEELDTIGVAAANRQAMERAVLALDPEPQALVLDACVLDLHLPQIGPIRGDRLCLSIAAASVIAKVHRDRLMTDYHHLDQRYHFAINKGYGTTSHLAALRRHGPGPFHRRSFALPQRST